MLLVKELHNPTGMLRAESPQQDADIGWAQGSQLTLGH